MSVTLSALGCNTRSSESRWVRLDSTEDAMGLFVAGGKERDVEMAVGNTSDRSIVVFELVNRGAQTIQFEQDLKATCGCVQATCDKTTLAPGEICRVSASLSQSSSPAKRTISLELTVVSPHFTKVNMFVNVTHVGDWSLSTNSLQLRGLLGSQSSRSFEIDGSKAALDAMTWDSVGDIEVKSSRPSDSRIIMTVESTIDSLLTEKIAGTIHLRTEAGRPANATLPVTQIAEPIGKWSPKAVVIAHDSPVAKCQVDLVEGAAIKSIEAPGLFVTSVADERTTAFEVSLNQETNSPGVQWLIATVSKGPVDQQIKLPVLVKLDSPREISKQ